SKLDNILQMYQYSNCDNKYIKDVIEEGNDYMFSEIHSKFMIVNLVHYINMESNSKKTKQYVEEMEKLVPQYEMIDQQLIYDYLACYYMNIDNSKALKLFEKALKCGEFKRVSTMLYYHLGIFYLNTNNCCLSIFYNNKSIKLFANELNFKRLFYAKQHVAIAFMKNKDYDLAEELCKDLLGDITISENQTKEIYSNISWALINQEKYAEALEYALKCEANNSEYFYHLSIIYLKLNDINEANNIINKGLQYYKKNEYQSMRMNIMNKIVNKQNRNNEFLALLKNAEKIMGNWGSNEDLEFVYYLFVDFYEEKFMYKEALKYNKKLLKIIN
ncbi:MAG: hypothetical protein RR585_11365, partial [Coprobacillus sp.]